MHRKRERKKFTSRLDRVAIPLIHIYLHLLFEQALQELLVFAGLSFLRTDPHYQCRVIEWRALICFHLFED